MARVLVVVSDDAHSIGPMAGWLGETGCAVDERRPYDADTIPSPRAYHGLIVLGGELQESGESRVSDEAPWLATLRDRIREAATLGVPTLGIGLGHQLAAVALGGKVAPSPYGELRGLLEIGWGCEVLLDPLFDRIAGDSRARHATREIVTTLPPAGVALAQTENGEIQAARLADTVWGVQFHPEDSGPDEDWQPLTWAFARLVRGRAGARGELWE
ncbi:type 1 glutamine amidotransferase [Nocardioides nematodiphilus]|uniref:type 1 glutamine amidotransferase n=1 Tax=Nocardioides nematodiphilus TaxID=2849669 RepID=UPI001CD92CAE|nr:type 1 glutamine amidotransferase [Nocardioides nematodiphilus]MCA1982156.1 type 1 glutamine amidotransferase [Nocardioides nematodiphilus]